MTHRRRKISLKPKVFLSILQRVHERRRGVIFPENRRANRFEIDFPAHI